MLPAGLDPELLRSFVLVAEGRSVTRAAERVGRTQSAVSMQMRRLEEVLGEELLRRGPRGLETTSKGAWLLERARTLLALNEEIITTFRAPAITGQVRLGSPDDYALQWLPGILARFGEAYPGIEVDVLCMSSEELAQRLAHGHLDMALLTEGQNYPGQEEVWRGPLRWVGPQGGTLHRRDPLPLAAAHPGCTWRRAALEALGREGRRVRVTYNSTTQSGCFAVALAGLAVTISTPTRLPPGLSWLGEADGLPELPEMGIMLAVGELATSAGAEALSEAIRQGFAQTS
ncbi:LysR substrate-binding domain-containing protein [Roseococcus pinisoli]|uniref:LysR family transcriptional regulator n=1 Tax=Roseococcus pinisoli TaxID=2835040 RepID=A0ABS5QGS0_9PROT|nr:LysR substrate-binding domain-containing protein [Roseococcus pinisoli]MBS7812879.1 LysR family transcriptional regulator [Roseococcus pinisoli]